jgi:uncharacterized surface protein with fasciclin (FAS1) repeats
VTVRVCVQLADHMKIRTVNGAAVSVLIDSATGVVTVRAPANVYMEYLYVESVCIFYISIVWQVRGSQGSATVVQADVLCSNGVAHVIDAVLLPPGGGH